MAEQEGRGAGVEVGEGRGALVEDMMFVHTGPGGDTWAAPCHSHLRGRSDFKRQDRLNLEPNLACRGGPFSRIMFQCFI